MHNDNRNQKEDSEVKQQMNNGDQRSCMNLFVEMLCSFKGYFSNNQQPLLPQDNRFMSDMCSSQKLHKQIKKNQRKLIIKSSVQNLTQSQLMMGYDSDQQDYSYGRMVESVKKVHIKQDDSYQGDDEDDDDDHEQSLFHSHDMMESQRSFNSQHLDKINRSIVQPSSNFKYKFQRLYDQKCPARFKFNKKEQNAIINDLPQQLKIMQITWNQMGQDQKQGVFDEIQQNLQQHDIISISSQECGRSILKSMIVSGKEDWEKNLINTLGEDFVKLQSISVNAMHMIIFVRKQIKKHVSLIETGKVSTGVANIVFNKGGISIGFCIKKHSFLFVNCHLASGQENASKRIKDFEQIEKQTQLKSCSKYKDENISNRFDSVIWSGDLNFRIDLTQEKVVPLIKEQQFHILLQNDQLYKNKGERILKDFKEGMIRFPPTYKMLLNSEEYKMEGKNNRIPGWTDRILYKSKENLLKQDNYESLRQIKTSDHRAVFGQFTYSLL